MPTKYKPRFATPKVIESIEGADLFTILGPFVDELRTRGVGCDGPEAIDRDALGALIVEGTQLPEGMLEVVCDLDNLAHPRHFDALRALAAAGGIVPDPHRSCHQLAVQVMLANPRGVQDLLAETGTKRLRRFDRIMATTERVPRAFKRTSQRRAALAKALDAAFIRLHRQRDEGVVRVIAADEAHGFRLSVRRGDVRRNQAVLDESDERVTRLLLHRPELFDLIRYDSRSGDLLVSPRARPEMLAYCQLIGKHLFNDRFLFDPIGAPPRYTLSPIIEEGIGCIIRGRITGVSEVRLHRLQFMLPGIKTPLMIGPGDVFSVLAALGGRFDPKSALMNATLKIRPRGGRSEETATITPPWGASYERDDAELIEAVIEACGFLLPREMSLHGTPETLFSVPGVVRAARGAVAHVEEGVC